MLLVYQQIAALAGDEGDPEAAALDTRQDLTVALTLPALPDWFGTLAGNKDLAETLAYVNKGPGGNQPVETGERSTWGSLLSWVLNHRLSQAAEEENTPEQNRTWMDEWLLGKINLRTLSGLGVEGGKAARQVELIKLLISHQDWAKPAEKRTLTAYQILRGWLKDTGVQHFISANRFQGILWFNKESFEELLWWMHTIHILQALLGLLRDPDSARETAKAIVDGFTLIKKLLNAEERSEYQVEKLLDAAKKEN